MCENGGQRQTGLTGAQGNKGLYIATESNKKKQKTKKKRQKLLFHQCRIKPQEDIAFMKILFVTKEVKSVYAC